MRIHFIDVSGNMPLEMHPTIRSNIRVGDTVGCFDTELHNVLVMASQEDIDNYKLFSGGGTAFQPISDYVKEVVSYDEPTLVSVYSDQMWLDNPKTILQTFDGLVSFEFVVVPDARGAVAPENYLDVLKGIYRSSVRHIDDQPTLFLAQFVQSSTPYMSDTNEESFTRLVLAHTRLEAQYKIECEFAKSDPYGVSRHVHNIELSEVIQ
jgi:hypothetical protein